MNGKKKWSKILLIFGVLIGVVGVSYALWRASFSSTNDNSLTATCFNVSFTDQNNISIEKAYPLLDKDGKKLTPYEFTITNNCDSYAKYDINLEVLNTSTLTNMDYIKLMLDDGTPALVSSYNVTTKTLSNASSAYKISTGYLNANESKTYNLRLWLDENVTGETEGVQNNTFTSKITVKASYAEELPIQTPAATNDIIELAKTDTTNLATDDYGNIRYIGKNPNNYVRVEGEEYTSDVYYGYSSSTSTSYNEYSSLEECTNASSYNVNCKVGKAKGTPILWRIIGVMKDIDDGTGNKSDRLKIVRNEQIARLSWDISESSVNNGRGVNEWSQADLMKLLNPGFSNDQYDNSLYWNNKAGSCHYGELFDCDFTSTGIKDSMKNLIDSAVWNTGSQGSAYMLSNGKPSQFYEYERSTNTGKICSSGASCNDTIERTTKWTGKIGLIYPSDYGYATSGGSENTTRDTCLNTILFDWSRGSGCKDNSWIYDGEESWTMMPYAAYDVANYVFFISGYVNSVGVGNAYNVKPSAYLKSSVKIVSGSGSQDDPFVLEN